MVGALVLPPKGEEFGGWIVGPELGNGLCGVVRKGYREEDPTDKVCFVLFCFWFLF